VYAKPLLDAIQCQNLLFFSLHTPLSFDRDNEIKILVLKTIINLLDSFSIINIITFVSGRKVVKVFTHKEKKDFACDFYTVRQ